ncbi:tetratricopeptide repeat protein [Nocardia concava]|uniref:tetratricopeptide repeat protein n=1 Tax=Nocardia concava TaxID=257281 RepID=UPI0002D3237B|nr:tetratricopeptide repeat protein [Nocardia concava]
MNPKLEQALTLAELGRPEAGCELATEVVAANPNDVRALYVLASLSLLCAENQCAFDCATSALAIAPEGDALWTIRARAAYNLSSGADPGSPDRVEWYRIAVSAARRAVELDPAKPENLVVYGFLLSPIDRAVGLAALDRALELDPENLEAFQLRSTIYRVAGEPDRAEESLREVLRLDPANAKAVHKLAGVARERGDLDEAAARLRQAGQLDPAGADEVRRELGWVLAEQRRLSEAASEPPPIEPARPHRVSPNILVDDPELLAELRRCDADRWRSIEPADVEQATARLAELRQEQPENADILYESALADWLCGRRRAAINRLRKVARLDPARMGQVEAHIATLEAEDERAIEARAARREKQTRQQHERQLENDVEHAAEQAIARRERRERAKVRRGLGSSASGVDLAAAVRVRRKIRWLVLIPALLLARLALYACASHADDHRSVPSPTTGAPMYQPYEPPHLPEIPPSASSPRQG